MKVLFIGDVMGSPGRNVVRDKLPEIRRHFEIDIVVANGENAAAGVGISQSVAMELFRAGVDVMTLGNHTWSKRDSWGFIDSDPHVVRPANFPAGVPGQGFTYFQHNDQLLAVVNLHGRTFIDMPLDCPFRVADQVLAEIKKKTRLILVDMHAEATSEKCAMGAYLDGQVSAVVGTHTHVQTADERILPCGTGFITDAGMTGPHEGIIGMDADIVLRRFTLGLPERFELATGTAQLNAVVISIDEADGRCTHIERINFISGGTDD